ncbi:MAG TPA: zf-HC2 domain-containing protein [Myxococcales bacterium]|nr:zf-HC2 domain-containing protein [Myxococcales bacterium]
MTEAAAALEHARLQELLAAFVDDELSANDGGPVEKHLRTCARCQREVALHRTLSRALSQEPVPAGSFRLRRRIEQMGPPPPGRNERAFMAIRRWAAPALAAMVVFGVGSATLLLRRGDTSRPFAAIPMLRDAVADCRRATARNFPRKADLGALAEAVPFPVHTLDRPDAELFSTWKTTLAGSPAAGLAYRWRGIVVIQYTVPGDVIRQQPDVGEALSISGYYASSQLGQGIVAIVADGSGTLLMADVPADELKRLIL